LEALFSADFGDRSEVLLRFAISYFSAALLFAFTLDMAFVIWSILYTVITGIYVLIARPRTHPVSTAHLYVALVFYFLSAGTFAGVMVLMFAQGTTAFYFMTGTVFFGMMFYQIQKPVLSPESAYLDATITVGTYMLMFYMSTDTFSSRSAFFTTLIICISATIYYLKSVARRVQEQRALREAQQRYARAQKARAMGQFVGGVAHEFNNQLTAITGNLELLDHLPTDEERKGAIEQVQEAARRASITVKQLLASSGRTRLSPHPTSMSEFFPRVQAVCGDLLDPGVTLTCIPPDDGHAVLVDRDMLETCMIQLCLNAQDALKGKGNIVMSSRILTESPDLDVPLEANAPYLAISIEDDGPGVQAAALPLLTEPFYTTKLQGEGPGLGLSAVSGFARQSKGGLHLAQGTRGLRATIVLPLLHAESVLQVAR
jgi:signal transduction histidine kinase